MAEFLMKYKLKKLNLSDKFIVESRATSSEEVGNSIHIGTRKILDKFGIDYSKKRATKITKEDVLNFDLIIGMDSNNIANLKRMFGKNKKFRLLNEKDIADPWYTWDFNTTYIEINEGLDNLLKELI